MGRYLDPKADVVFKKIFGEHPDILKSFLNALLPLSEDQQIVSLEYLPSEQIPSIPAFKRTIVDVKCRDREGRIFIVEMQLDWTNSFMQRLLFGSAQAYVKQLSPGDTYHLLNPVYGLGLIDSIFDHKTPVWYHHYGVVKVTDPREELINGLTLIFVELPKFQPTSVEQKRLRILWLRFLRELDRKTGDVDPALQSVPEIAAAISLAEEAVYTPGELEVYESYWKAVSSERTLIEAAMRDGKSEGLNEGIAKGRAEGIAEGILKGREEGIAEGMSKGREEAIRAIARTLRDQDLSFEAIADATGLAIDEIEGL